MKKKSVILKEYRDCTNSSALSNLLAMVIVAQPPPRNPEAPSSIGKAGEAIKNGTSMATSKILFVFNFHYIVCLFYFITQGILVVKYGS